MTRSDVIAEAVEKCMRELYSLAQPKITWEEFLLENKEYNEKVKEWEKIPEANRLNRNVTCGPAPYNFYYLPKDIMKEICDSYVSAYKLDSQEELLTTINILKDYCLKPIADKWIEGHTDEDGFEHPGHRGYDHPDNLEKEIFKIIDDNIPLYQPPKKLVFELRDKFFEFLDMAGNFYNWNHDLNAFNINTYLGGSPHSVRERVIENWKKYRNKDITIDDDSVIREKYYGYLDEDE